MSPLLASVSVVVSRLYHIVCTKPFSPPSASCGAALAAKPSSPNFSLKPIAELDQLGDGGSRVTLFHLSSDAPSSLVGCQLIKDGDSFGVIYPFDHGHSTSHYFFLEPFYYAHADQLELELGTCPEPATTTRFPMQEPQASVDLKGFSFTYKKGAGEGRHSSEYGVSLFTPSAFNFPDIKFLDAAGDEVSISPVRSYNDQEMTSTLYHLTKSAVASITEDEVTYYPGPYSHVRIPFPEIVPAVKAQSAVSWACATSVYDETDAAVAAPRLFREGFALTLSARTPSLHPARGTSPSGLPFMCRLWVLLHPYRKRPTCADVHVGRFDDISTCS